VRGVEGPTQGIDSGTTDGDPFWRLGFCSRPWNAYFKNAVAIRSLYLLALYSFGESEVTAEGAVRNSDLNERASLSCLLSSRLPSNALPTLEVCSVAALLSDAIGCLHREEPFDDLARFE
jgi:hypothetical protein